MHLSIFQFWEIHPKEQNKSMKNIYLSKHQGKIGVSILIIDELKLIKIINSIEGPII